jgi:hypothetical protein
METVVGARLDPGETTVPTTLGSAAPLGLPTGLSTIEDETFDQIFTNNGVHTTLAEVLTTRAMGGTTPSLAVEDVLRDCATAAAATQQLHNSEDLAAGLGGSGGSPSGARAGRYGWQPQRVFNAILAMETGPHVEGADPSMRKRASAPAAAAAINTRAAARPATTVDTVAPVGTITVANRSSSGGGGSAGALRGSPSTAVDSSRAQGKDRSSANKRRPVDLKSLLSRLDYTSGPKK